MGAADPEVIGMTTRAVGLVRRRAPGDRLTVAPMAIGAVEIISMVSRIDCPGMIETRRCPALRSVARVAGKHRREVPTGRASRRRPIVT